MEQHWDVIVVGARCAGATLSAALAKRGLRVVMVEAAARGTGMPMSTHFLQAPGMDVLDRLGIGDRVREVTPPAGKFRFEVDGASTRVCFPEGRNGYCVRRSTLDPWLQEAAETAGATLLDRHRVVDLVHDGDRVAGVIARGPSGSVTLRADLVVGADGCRSTIAQLTGAEEYLVTESSRAGYWTYYEAPAQWNEDWDAILQHRGDDLRYVFRCDGDTVVVVYVGPRERVNGWGRDYRDRLTNELAASAVTRRYSEGKSPVGKTIGLLGTRYYYRNAVGPGWALAGDAGHFKDFVTGHGMTDALLDAEYLAEAILDGRPEAYELYWRERDVRTLPLHFDAIRQGEVGYNEPFLQWLIHNVSKRPDLNRRMADVFDRKLRPDEFLTTPTLLRFMAGALLRGRFNVVPGFLATGRRMETEAKELAARTALRDAAKTALQQAAPKTVWQNRAAQSAA